MSVSTLVAVSRPFALRPVKEIQVAISNTIHQEDLSEFLMRQQEFLDAEKIFREAEKFLVVALISGAEVEAGTLCAKFEKCESKDGSAFGDSFYRLTVKEEKS